MRETDDGARLPSLRELEVLCTMIATRKTVATAHYLGISQPAVSRLIAGLEARVGQRLFTRTGGRLVPTAEAFSIEAEASQIFAALGRIAFQPAQQGGRTTVRIATTPTLAHYVLPREVAQARIAEPESLIEIEIGTGTEVIAQVADRRVDFGIVDTPSPHPAIRAEAFREGIAHVFLQESDPLAAQKALTVRDIADRDLIAHARRFRSRAEFERIFAAAGHIPRFVVTTTTAALSLELVRAGVGLAIANPYPLTLSNFAGLVARPFLPAIAYQVCLLFPAEGTVQPAARRIADRLKGTQTEDGLTSPVRQRS